MRIIRIFLRGWAPRGVLILPNTPFLNGQRGTRKFSQNQEIAQCPPQNRELRYPKNYKGCTVSPTKNIMARDNGRISRKKVRAKIRIHKEKPNLNPRP